MSTARLRQLFRSMQRLASAGWKASLLKSLAVEAEALTKECFERSRDPYGRRWKQLNPAFRTGQPLRDTGVLMNSIHARVLGGRGFAVSTNHPGAQLHNRGGVVLPRRGKRLVFVTGAGTKVFAKKVTIPARPFFPDSGRAPKAWVRALDATATDFMRRELARAR